MSIPKKKTFFWVPGGPVDQAIIEFGTLHPGSKRDLLYTLKIHPAFKEMIKLFRFKYYDIYDDLDHDPDTIVDEWVGYLYETLLKFDINRMPKKNHKYIFNYFFINLKQAYVSHKITHDHGTGDKHKKLMTSIDAIEDISKTDLIADWSVNPDGESLMSEQCDEIISKTKAFLEADLKKEESEVQNRAGKIRIRRTFLKIINQQPELLYDWKALNAQMLHDFTFDEGLTKQWFYDHLRALRTKLNAELRKQIIH